MVLPLKFCQLWASLASKKFAALVLFLIMTSRTFVNCNFLLASFASEDGFTHQCLIESCS